MVKDFHYKSLHQKIEPLILFLDPANALLTVSYQSVKTALANPVNSLKYE